MEVDTEMDAPAATSNGQQQQKRRLQHQNDASTALRELAARMHHARTEGNPTDEILASALQHFAKTRAALRASALINKHEKASVAETRNRMDATFLAQQNREYEINHLYREIEKCNDYDSIYQDLPLLTEDKYTEAAMEDQNQDPHQRMVARLRFEVSERQRAQAELKTLLASKTKVIKDTEARKQSLEQLEKQLDDFVASAKAIQSKFATM